MRSASRESRLVMGAVIGLIGWTTSVTDAAPHAGVFGYRSGAARDDVDVLRRAEPAWRPGPSRAGAGQAGGSVGADAADAAIVQIAPHAGENPCAADEDVAGAASLLEKFPWAPAPAFDVFDGDALGRPKGSIARYASRGLPLARSLVD